MLNAVQVPSDFTIYNLHGQSTNEDVQELVRNKPSVRAYLGPGQASEPDWWLILDVDQNRSADNWRTCRTLIIQGQSKLVQEAGVSTLSAEVVMEEYKKRFTGFSKLKAKSLFVLVTDQTVSHDVTNNEDILLVGNNEHAAYYGVAGSMKRKIMGGGWTLSKRRATAGNAD